MNRLIICIILLAFSQATFAEKLYRWIEADGSITFSPNPPPKGVDFKVMDSGQINASKLAPDLPDATQVPKNTQPSIMATSEHALDTAPAARINDTEILTRPAPAVSKQRLSYAPDTSNATTISRQNAAPALATAQATVPAQQTIASSNKQKQCQDLSKRVMSLERRLRMPLEPVDMDNTVIAMARYQRSYDQHCIN